MRILMLLMLVAASACDTGRGPNDAGRSYDLARTFDFTVPAATVICTPPGMVSCADSKETFYASTTESGCYPTNMPPPNDVADPVYNGTGMCPASYNVVGCTSSPNCSFCLKGGLAIPPGCKVM